MSGRFAFTSGPAKGRPTSRGFNPALHPRHPAKAPQSRGGEFRKAGTYGDSRDHIDPAEHAKIIASETAGGIAVDEPHVTMMGGGTAAGKSTLRESGFIEIEPGTIVVDPDETKAQLSGYREMVAAGEPGAAGYYHEESSMLTREIIDSAQGRNYNVLYDAVGDSGYDKLADKIGDLGTIRDAAGNAIGQRRVDGVYVTRDVEASIAAAEARARAPGKDFGRHVASEKIRILHRNVSRVVPRAIDNRLWTNFRLYSTNFSPPHLIAQYTDRGPLVIYDQSEWREFLAKGDRDADLPENA